MKPSGCPRTAPEGERRRGRRRPIAVCNRAEWLEKYRGRAGRKPAARISMSQINDILRNAVQAKASDIHIMVGAPPLYRVHTIVQPSDFPMVTPEGAMRICKEVLGEKRWPHFEDKRDADFSYQIPGLAPSR